MRYLKCGGCGYWVQSDSKYCGRCARAVVDDYQRKRLKLMLTLMSIGAGVGVLFFLLMIALVFLKILSGAK